MNAVAEKNAITIAPEIHAPAVLTPMEMLNRAVEQGADLDVLEKLMGLQERWEKNQAKKSFDAALAAAKSEIPVIGKNREVDFTSQKGRTHYRHEDLAGIAKVVDPILSKHGLSYRFRTTSNPNEPVTVTCIISHRDGYSEENVLSAGRDESGNKNSIQAVGSTITYLQRYTLKAALGLAAANDDDGKASETEAALTEQQIKDLSALIESTGSNLKRFCGFFKIEKLEDLPAARLEEATNMLNAKAK